MESYINTGRSVKTMERKHAERGAPRARTRRRRRQALKRIQQFLRSQGVKLSLEETRNLVDRLAPLVPRIVPQPRGKAEALHVVVERNGNLEAIATARAPVLLQRKSGRIHRFKTVLSIDTGRGRFRFRADKNAVALTYSAFNIFDYVFLNKRELELIQALMPLLMENARKSGGEKLRIYVNPKILKKVGFSIFGKPCCTTYTTFSKEKNEILKENLKEILKEKREAGERWTRGKRGG